MIFDRKDIASLKTYTKDAFNRSSKDSYALAEALGCDRNNIYMAFSHNTAMRNTLYDILLELGYVIELHKDIILVRGEHPYEW